MYFFCGRCGGGEVYVEGGVSVCWAYCRSSAVVSLAR